MIDENRWIKKLSANDKKFNQKTNELDVSISLETTTQKVNFLDKKNSIKKYSVVTILFISGLVLVSTIKNETRSLQKEVHSLETSINNLKFELHQATLDYNVITSPENLSRLANDNLDIDLTSYKKKQILNLNSKEKNIYDDIEKKKNITGFNIKNNIITKKVKNEMTKKNEEKINILQKVYYDSKETLPPKKVTKWAAIQIVKAFLGIPVMPGR